MKKYTNKILLITLIVMAVLFVVIGTVEIRKAFHNGQVKKTEELFKERLQNNSDKEITEFILDADTIQVVNVQTENEK